MPVSISGTTGYAGPLGAITVDTGSIVNNAVTTAKIADANVTVAKLSATGSPSASTYLRGDNTWATVSGGVTSLAAGNGIAVSASTGAVTVSLDFYTGTTVANTSYPVGTYIGSVQSGDGCSYSNPAPNANLPGLGLRITGDNFKYGAGTTGIAGTWRSRSSLFTPSVGSSTLILIQRVA